MGTSLEEKKALVLNSFKRAFDYELALEAYEVTEEERDLMEADPRFWIQMKQAEAKMKEDIVVRLMDIADPNQNPKVNTQLEALKELGRILYSERFRPQVIDSGDEQKVVFYVPDNGRGEGSATQGSDNEGTVE